MAKNMWWLLEVGERLEGKASARKVKTIIMRLKGNKMEKKENKDQRK